MCRGSRRGQSRSKDRRSFRSLIRHRPWRRRGHDQPLQHRGPEVDFNLSIAILRPSDLAFYHVDGVIRMALQKTARASCGAVLAIREHSISPSTDIPARVGNIKTGRSGKAPPASKKAAPVDDTAFPAYCMHPPQLLRVAGSRQSCSDHIRNGRIVNRRK